MRGPSQAVEKLPPLAIIGGACGQEVERRFAGNTDRRKRCSALYSHTGRPSIPPEYLLRATLLQILYSVRSERLLVEQLDYNLLFRWFIGLSMGDPIWDHSTSGQPDPCRNQGSLWLSHDLPQGTSQQRFRPELVFPVHDSPERGGAASRLA